MRNAKFLPWSACLLACFGLGGGLSACRHAAAPPQTNQPTAAAPAPQPSVCAAENVSRAAMLRQAQVSASPSPTTAAQPRQSR